MKKILLILTGGTIGSRIDNNGNISPSSEPLLLNKCRSKLPADIEFSVLEPLCVLSENMTLKDRESLIQEVLKADTNLYDGIIIAHGSDTITYTASLTAMALRHIEIPIVFIASDKVLSDPLSNGPDNFISAVDFITDGVVKRGCYICYKDSVDRNAVYLATRLCESEPIFDSFHSIDNTYFGTTENGKFIYNNHHLNPTIAEINKPKARIIPNDFKLKPIVSMLRSSPAFDYSRYNINGLSAIVNYGYHCGTTPEKCFLEFAKDCNDKKVDVWLASFKDPEAPIYDSLSRILSLPNVHRLYNISPEAAYSKILLAYSVNKSIINDNLFFENL